MPNDTQRYIWLPTIDDIIEKAIELVDQHELIRSPISFTNDGSPIRITRYRNFGGFDNNTSGLTLSIYPYAYTSSSLTVSSGNAAIVYDSHHTGDKSRGGFERGTLNLTVELSTTGMQTTTTPMSPDRPVEMVSNEYERALRKWVQILAAILLSKPLVNVAGYVKNSRVNYGHFLSTKWTGTHEVAGKGGNAVLHSATLVWQLDFWPLRDLSMLPYMRVPSVTQGWKFIGIRSKDQMNVYYDGDRKDIVTSTGYPLRVTPGGIPVKWNPDLARFENSKTGAALTASELVDPQLAPKPWIDTSVRIIGILRIPATETDPADQKSLYLETSTNRLRLADNTTVTALSDGSPLSYDPATQRLVLVPASTESPTLLIDFTDPNRFKVNVFNQTPAPGGNGTLLDEQFSVP